MWHIKIVYIFHKYQANFIQIGGKKLIEILLQEGKQTFAQWLELAQSNPEVTYLCVGISI